jgi:single-stranded-DNA-specific exonuclease
MLPLKKWNIVNTDTQKSVIDAILENRNLSSDHLKPFKLSEKLHDPYLLEDMDKAVNCITEAVREQKKIAIFGDYDTDGVASTAMLGKFFEKIGYPIEYMLPSRQKDGYGLKPDGVREAIERGVQLLITVDNGISSHDAVDLANEKGLEVLITDHHLQENELPNAVGVVNPNRKNSSYPFNGLCGAGVVYKLLQALAQKTFEEDEYKNFMLAQLDLVALATIADIVPLKDENYALVKFGLKSLRDTGRPGIVELKRVSGLLGKEITTTSIGYYLAPRLNAAGRLGDAYLALNLLISKNLQEAAEHARALNKLNIERQKLQESYIIEAIEFINKDDVLDQNICIVENDNWDPGIIGIVSGKLKDKLSKPVIVFTRDGDGNYVGSARSTDNFHITHALSRYQELFLNYGGHKKAAGLTISPENFQRFKDELTKHGNDIINTDDLVPELVIDTVVTADQVSLGLVEIIEKIGPFGEQNPEPTLVMRNAVVKDLRLLGNGNHLKLVLQSGNYSFECVWWRKSNLKDEIKFGMNVDLAFKPSLNFWNGYTRLQLVLEDMKPVN